MEKKSKNRLKLEKKSNKLTIQKALQILLIPKDSITELQTILFKKGKIAVVKEGMYEAGKTTGLQFYSLAKESFKLETYQILKEIPSIWTNAGYGKIAFKELKLESKIEVEVKHSPFRNCTQKKVTCCFWISGMLTGLFNNLTKKEWIFEEHLCSNNGDKKCYFIGVPQKEKVSLKTLGDFRYIDLEELRKSKFIKKKQTLVSFEELMKEGYLKK